MSGDQLVRLLKVLGLAALVALVLLGGWRLYKGLKWVHDQNARADQLPTLEELIGPPIPDEENAAVVYQQAFDAFDLSHEDEDVLAGEKDPDQPRRATYDLPRLEAVIAKNERALALLERAAAMEKCRFPADWSDAVGVRFDHFAQMRQATRLQAGKARVLASEGHMADALDAIATCLDLGHDGRQGAPNIISWLVEAAMDSMALRAARDMVDGRDCPREASARLRARLRETDMVGSFTWAFKGEAAFGLLAMQQMLQTTPRQRAKGDKAPTPRGPSASSLMNWASRPYYVKFMTDYMELAPLPYRQSRQQWAELEAQIERIPRYAMLCELFLPVFARGVARRDEMCARIELCVVALDLNAYKHERSTYPEALDQLPQAPEKGYAEDVFSGQPLRYQRHAEGFLLYSFGKDLDDDGGKPLGRMVNGKPEWDDGDLVWRCSR